VWLIVGHEDVDWRRIRFGHYDMHPLLDAPLAVRACRMQNSSTVLRS
jgi:hypothetical protein